VAVHYPNGKNTPQRVEAEVSFGDDVFVQEW
jgi:hypothetical protein